MSRTSFHHLYALLSSTLLVLDALKKVQNCIRRNAAKRIIWNQRTAVMTEYPKFFIKVCPACIESRSIEIDDNLLALTQNTVNKELL